MEPTKFNSSQVTLTAPSGTIAASMTDAPEGGFHLTYSNNGYYPSYSSYFYPELDTRIMLGATQTQDFIRVLGYSALRGGIFCCYGNAGNGPNSAYSIINDTTVRNVALNLQYASCLLTDLNAQPNVVFAESADTIVTSGLDDLNLYNHLAVCKNTDNTQTGNNQYYLVDFGDPADVFYACSNNGTEFLLSGVDSIGAYVRKCLNTADATVAENWIRFDAPVDIEQSNYAGIYCFYPIPNSSVWLAGGSNNGGYGAIWKSLDGGETWIELTVPDAISDEVICGIDSVDGHFLAVTPYGSAYKTDDIDSWGDAISIGDSVDAPLFYDNKALASGNGFRCYVAGSGIYFSTDNGATWNAPVVNPTSAIDCLRFHPVENKFYLSEHTGGTAYSFADPSDASTLLDGTLFNAFSLGSSGIGLLNNYYGIWIKL